MSAQPKNPGHDLSTEGVTLQAHFDEWSQDYDGVIHRMFPDYKQVFDTVFQFTDLPSDTPRILELGVGTGNLTMRTLQDYPNAHYTLLDLSEEMLAKAEVKMKRRNISAYELAPVGFMDADFTENRFDLIITSLALHHLQNDEKPILYKRIFNWLKPGGQFRCIDGHHTLPAATGHAKVWEAMTRECRALGVTDEEFAMWRDHESKYDHFVSLSQHFTWLQEAGFQDVDCYWKRLLIAIFGGAKPSA